MLSFEPKKGLWLGFGFIWFAALVLHYFTLQNVFDFSFLYSLKTGWASAQEPAFWHNARLGLGALGTSALASLTLWRWGRMIFRWSFPSKDRGALGLCQQMAVGILFFNSLWLGLGFNGLWSAPLALCLAMGFLGIALWDIAQELKGGQKLSRMENPGFVYGLVGGLGVLIFFLSLIQGFVPEVYFDALGYHLSTLEFWMFHHGITDFRTNLYSYYPFGGEFYLLNGFFFSGGQSAKMLNALAFLLCGLAVGGWVKKEAGPSNGWLAFSMTMVFPLMSTTAWAAQNDLLLTFFLVLFFYSLTQIDEAEHGWGLSALWGAAAMSVKYTALLGLACGLAAFFLNRRNTAWSRKDWGAALAMVMFLAMPWYLKNWTYRGNPLYPYFSMGGAGENISPEKLHALMGDEEAVNYGNFNLWTWGAKILTRDLDKTIAPLLYGFLPFFFIPTSRGKVTRYLLLLGFCYLLSGFLVCHQLRLLMPALVISFAAMILVLRDLPPDWRWSGKIWAWIVLAFGLWSLCALTRLGVDYYQVDKVLLGEETVEEYLGNSPQTSSYYELTQRVGTLLPKGDCLLVIGDARGLYYPRSFYTNSVFDGQLLADWARKAPDARGIWLKARERGIDDLVIPGEEALRLSRQTGDFNLLPGEWKKLDQFIQEYSIPIYIQGENGIYHLRSSPETHGPQVEDLLWPLFNR